MNLAHLALLLTAAPQPDLQMDYVFVAENCVLVGSVTRGEVATPKMIPASRHKAACKRFSKDVKCWFQDESTDPEAKLTKLDFLEANAGLVTTLRNWDQDLVIYLDKGTKKYILAQTTVDFQNGAVYQKQCRGDLDPTPQPRSRK